MTTDLWFMDRGPQVASLTVGGSVETAAGCPPRYGWNYVEDSSSDEEVPATNIDDVESPVTVDVASPSGSLDCDSYASPPSFSPEPVLGAATASPTSPVPRRSCRDRRPYHYRGIEDYVQMDDDIWDGESRVIRRSAFCAERTLTTESNLSAVGWRGEEVRDRRSRGSPDSAAHMGDSRGPVLHPATVEVVPLPSNRVMMQDRVLDPVRLLVPEQVVLQRCQDLEAAVVALHGGCEVPTQQEEGVHSGGEVGGHQLQGAGGQGAEEGGEGRGTGVYHL